MRLATYWEDGLARLGVVRDDGVVEVDWWLNERASPTMIDLIAAGPDVWRKVSKMALDKKVRGRPLSSVRLLAPIPRPRKNIFCVGQNYLAHAQEAAQARGKQYVPLEYPTFFTKPPTAVSGPDDPIPYPTGITEQLDWEGELAVVIGVGGKNIPEADALKHVFGYTIINDVTARDVQNRHGGQFFRGKALDGFCPMGPWIVTADELPDPQALQLTTHVNGVLQQDSSTADMIFTVARVLAELSQGLTLEPGDVIATGTPSGVGMGHTPPQWLRPGDVVEITISGLGTLRNLVAAE